MESDFEKLARSRLPEEALFIHFDVGAFTGEGIIELRDGRLLIVAEEHRLVSADGGETWSTYDPLLDEEERKETQEEGARNRALCCLGSAGTQHPKSGEHHFQDQEEQAGRAAKKAIP